LEHRLTDIAALHALIEPEARALGFDLVRVKMTGGKGDPTLQIMAERPDTRQLTIDDCSALSHRVSDVLDQLEAEGRDPIKEAYRLEVSSPGIDRPLTRLGDFADWQGHEARIRLVEPTNGRKQLTGNLAGIEGEVVIVDLGAHGLERVTFANIDNAKLTMTDRLIAATAPLSTDGADEFEDVSDDTQAEDSH
jgi:ribosome maturation factor RimP